MKLEFTRLILRDFKEYRGKHALDLSVLGNGVHYIRGLNSVDEIGSNGAGKSTLWDAFMWALCGRTVRGLRGTDVRTWEGDENAVCRVDFYCDDKPHYVKRSTEKNGLWLDGKLTSQEEIDRVLGLSIVNIPHTIILGQKQELFFDLKPQPKLEVLSETLQLDKWDVRSKRAKDLAAKLETRHASIEFHMAQSTTTLEETRVALEEAKAKVADFEKDRSQTEDRLQMERDALVKKLTEATKEIGTYDLQYDGAETELRAVRKDLIKKQTELEELNVALAMAIGKHNTLANEYSALREMAQSDTCPTCNQSIAKHRQHAESAKLKLRDVKKRRDIASDRVIVREAQITLQRKAIKVMREAEVTFGEKSNVAKDKLDHLNERISTIKQEIAVLKAQSRGEERNPYSALVSETRHRIKTLKASLAESQEQSDKLSRRIIRTKYWIDAFKQVRLYLLQETLEELQEVTQNILPDLGLNGWIVEYAIDREKKDGSVSTGLTVTILKPGMSKAVRWEAWSGGEGQRLLIAGAMALSEVLLRRAGIECDLLVLDEPTRHMSKEGVNDTVDYLIDRGRSGQIFYVDHQVIESNRFASMITIQKDEHGAQIKTTTT